MTQHKKTQTILTPERNCWTVPRADRLSFLVDGKAYFEAFAAAARKARQTIFILGWEIDSRVVLERDEHGSGQPLRKFLNSLAEASPGLEIYLLIWDYAVIYLLEREPVPLYSLGWKTHPRVHFVADAKHPLTASHHQKVVVIDDQVAFCGGLDLTKNRWDTTEHAASNKARTTPSGVRYEPFHDVQALVSGEAARCLGELFRMRWQKAGQTPAASAHDPQHDCWPEGVEPDVTDVRVGISRTLPRYQGHSEVREVQALHEDAIAAARQYIYFENQYFTSYAVRQALELRLEREDCPEIVMVLPKHSQGWLEESTMDVLRARLVERLRRADSHAKLKVYYPYVPGLETTCLKVHAKVMVVDDELVKVGSSNLSNRSMGLDTECDLTLEAQGEKRIQKAVASLRNRLLAEHLGTDPKTVRQAVEQRGSLIGAVAALQSGGRSLRELEISIPEWAESFYPNAEWLDPERPLRVERFFEELGNGSMSGDGSKKGYEGLIKLGGLLVLLLALAGAWRWTPLQEWLSVERIFSLAQGVKGNAYAPLMVLGTFLLASFVAFPITILVGATALLFGPWESILYSSVGAFAGAAGSYGLGRLLGRDAVRRFAGEKLNSISRRLASQGIVTVAIARNLPVAPFTIVNVVAGASHISFKDYMVGTILGMLPGIALITLFSTQLKNFLQDPNMWMFALLLLLAVALVVGGYFLKGWLEKKAPPSQDPSTLREGSGKTIE